MQLFDLFNFEKSTNILSTNQPQSPGLITFSSKDLKNTKLETDHSIVQTGHNIDVIKNTNELIWSVLYGEVINIDHVLSLPSLTWSA